MNRNECIQYLKSSITCPALWPKEVQEVADDIIRKNSNVMFEYHFDGMWRETISIRHTPDNDYYNTVHRLKSDYTEEPEKPKYIDVEIYDDEDWFKLKTSPLIWATSAPSITKIKGQKVEFAGYVDGKSNLCHTFFFNPKDVLSAEKPIGKKYEKAVAARYWLK